MNMDKQEIHRFNEEGNVASHPISDWVSAKMNTQQNNELRSLPTEGSFGHVFLFPYICTHNVWSFPKRQKIDNLSRLRHYFGGTISTSKMSLHTDFVGLKLSYERSVLLASRVADSYHITKYQPSSVETVAL